MENKTGKQYKLRIKKNSNKIKMTSTKKEKREPKNTDHPGQIK